jgi:Domain of unknown function (DUF4114)
MTDIRLGQNVAGSLTSSDLKISDVNSPFNGFYYDEYDLQGVDSFRLLNISLQRPTTTTTATTLQLINAANGAVVSQDILNSSGTLLIGDTTFTGLNYKIRVINANLGDYQLTLEDKGKATSIASAFPTARNGSAVNFGVGTINASGTYAPLASSVLSYNLTDVALAADGQFYGITSVIDKDILLRIDPGTDRLNQIALVGPLKDTQGKDIPSGINALEFSADNQLYAIGNTPAGAKLYQINLTNRIASLVANLPTGFVSSGDLVYDAPNNRFLATSADTVTSDALWQIPIGNAAGATKIGQIGFTNVAGVSFENGQLTGFTIGTGDGKRIKIDASNGVGTLDQTITGSNFTVNGIGGASTIPTPTVQPTAPLIFDPLTNIGTVKDGTKIFEFSPTQRDSTKFTNEFGIYKVDDASGKVNGLTPGSAGFLKAAFDRAQVIFSALDGRFFDPKASRKLNLATNDQFGFYIVQDGTTETVKNDLAAARNPQNQVFFGSGNPDGEHLKVTQTVNASSLAWEDATGGGDKDFNDLVVKIAPGTSPAPIGTSQQGSKEIFDFTGATANTKANFEIKRDAAYDNHVGFYKIEDALGTIKVGGTFLKPGDQGYLKAAIDGRIAGVDITGMNNQTTTSTTDFQAGGLYAPLIIANSATANADFSNVFTAYSLGNADKTDHIRQLGDNTFGFEDLFGGGDKDFNDIIIKATFQ